MRLYAKNSSVVYLALLHAFGWESVTLPAVAPTFFAAVAKMRGVDIELVDVGLDYSSDAMVVHNFFESFEPKVQVVFQNWGEPVGEARVWVMKYKDCVMVECDEEIGQKLELFLNGGIKKGRLWNYDLVDIGIKNLQPPCDVPMELVEESNETVAYLDERFRGNPYFDTLSLGTKTIKSEYPILLKPSLYCPKEDIYQELQQKGIDVKVRFKPLYRTTLLSGEYLPTSEELYKAVLVLPLAKEIVEPLMGVLEKYRYRGCSF